MNQIWDRIDTWLDANAPDVKKSLNSGATDKDIADAEAVLGVSLPDDVKASYKIHNGQVEYDMGFINSREFLSLKRIVDEWSVWNDLLQGGDFSGAKGNPDAGIKDDWWNARWIPLTYDGSGNHDCLDLDPAPGGNVGQIIEMWHDDADRALLAPSFTEWLTKFADDLEAGEYVFSEDYNGLVSKNDM
jgi:cell wall assembly regulator SMI1